MAFPVKTHARLWILSLLLLTLSLLFLSKSSTLRGESPLSASPLAHSVVNQEYLDLDLYQSTNLSQLAKRDGNYSCKKGVPCKTYACCGSFLGGDTGTCGFGPTFCGSDCDSQCNAKSECGQYADPPGKECPLNVCCSKYGFCGSTSDFCGADCQSNCVLNPPVPAGGSGVTVLNNKVIGYYEAWAARRTCRSFPPGAIPVEGLTHVNFAFAYIDPGTLQVTTMDALTPESLFAQTTDIKNMKSRSSDLEVFVSIGGWTFSDNGTATQPLFPAIAADVGKRQKFADNLVSFMTRYGFDGVDIDWEYPGAPDRGGNGNQDAENFVLLLQTLRSTFEASPRGNYGLSFTIPTSYWYLRWFDVPGMLKYADWVNLMSYDLHGVWDEHNPIGSIVQGHTNLTEIKLAVDLLWRNNVSPGKVVLGIGFYGRTFQLRNGACSTPGCAFGGPANAGPCTNSAGTLAYFEIMDIINKEKPKVVHDTDAAVNYMAFGDNHDQWVSFDDATTLKQKVDWANSVSLGGVMIWSVDQDDDVFSALEGLLGKSLPSFQDNLKRTQTADTNHWSSVNGQACKISDCLDDHANPPSGFSLAPNGQYQDTCGTGDYGQQYKYIWCPTDALPQSCEWRGSGSCHGQCHEGEVTLAHSPHGSLSCLKPGQQAFCCVSNTWATFVDKCGWANGCDDCPSNSQYSVSSRSIRKGLFGSCTQHFCCPYNFQNCHWVGKGTCDDNECSATDVQVGLDPTGDTGSQCAGGLNGRLKPLCCNTPQDLNPFLPVPLENLFPTLPPAGDLPAFDQQTLSQNPRLVGENPEGNAFFFVVIDGPPGTVSNINKRDGSHLEFVTGAVHHGQASQSAHFICMDSSSDSNCDDMHLDGLEGTIVRMPDDMGFAQWAVAHRVAESNFTVPHLLAKRAPPGAKVYELEYSYDFSKVKRDSGPVYLRVDYSDSHTYYTDIVQAPHEKRDLEPRFWSAISSIWKTLISRLRGQQYDPSLQPTLSTDHFNVLIYGDDGHDKSCSGADGFLKLNLAGSMRNIMRFGFTLVGTIQPFALEEAYGYFDSDLYMSGQLDFDGKGVLNINKGAGVARDLFSSPITRFQASHPGVISFSPELNAQVSLVGSGQIDGQFSVNFETGTSRTMTTNAPPGLGTFDGDILHNVFNDAAHGHLAVDDASFNTIFAMNLNMETSMNMKLFGYETALQDAGAQFTARTPHALRIVGDTGTGKPGIMDAPQQASSDVIQTGTVQDGWDDGVTHAIGSMPSPVIIFNGGEAPPNPREVPNINGYAVFGDRNFMSCSSGSYTGKLICTYDIASKDTSLVQPDPPYKLKLKLKREHLEPLTEKEAALYDNPLQKRAPGPSGGSAANYPIYEYPGNPNGGTNAFNFETPTYPAGNNGAALDAENGRNERYALANPNDCEDTTITANGVQGVNYDGVDSEHPLDRSVFPNHFANYLQSGELDLADGQGGTFRTNLPMWTWRNMYDYFGHEYRTWVPPNVEQNPPVGSASRDVANAMGSTGNPDVMSNLERNLNILKGRLYTTEGVPTSNDQFDFWMANPSQGTAEAALSALRAVFGVFNYMTAIHSDRQRVIQDINTALQQFDNIYARTFPNRPERMAPLWAEFQPQWETRVTNFAQRYVTQRLNQMDNVYQALAQPGSPQQQLALDVLNAVGNAHKPLVSIPGGAIISGYLESGTEQFLGIPFGQDTSGANRFAPPKPATVVPGFKIDGTMPGPACPQSVDPQSFLPYLNSNVTLQSEDCLNLRIARPAGTTSHSALPVMVFLYGGGFTTGQIYDKFYTPEGMVRQSAQSGQPVVYVAVNYRLSIFGFANSQTLFDQKSLNVGLRDQRLALEWVRANIAHFGGDPDKVTLFGQSAGAFSVGLQITAFGGKRPVAFTRAILQGGAPQSNLGATGSVSSQRFAAVSSLVNCTIGTADSPATLDCMRALPLNTLLSTELAYASLVMPPAGGRAFTPVVDGDFIPDAPSSLVATGQFAPNVSIIQGWNENDGSLYTPLSITNETGVLRFLKTLAPGLTNASLSTALQYYPITDFTPLNSTSTSAQFSRGARMIRDIVFTCPAIQFAEAVAKKGSDAYLYNLNQTAFARRFAAANEQYLGVSHYSDIPYVFNSVSLVSPPDSPLASDIRLALKFSDSWSAFASTGSSCGGGQSICHWPKAFSSREHGVEATVEVIGGPDAGPKELTKTGGKGPFSTENLWERCAFIQRVQSEFRV